MVFDDTAVKKKPKKVRVAREEYLNRSGHWERDFSSRSEPWPIIEHWAAEQGYYLVAMRGPKRLYQKGDNERRFVSLVEVRQHERRVTLSAWVHVGWLGRLMNFFCVPKEMGIEPYGFWGVVARRDACRDLNVLLLRMGQPLIQSSQGFHLLDWHASNLALLGVLIATTATFLAAGLTKVSLRQGLTNPLLQSLGQTAAVVGILLLLLFGIQLFVERRYLEHPAAKWGLASALAAFHILTAVILGTWTRAEMGRHNVAHFCIAAAEAKACQKALEELPPKERAVFRARIEALGHELSLRP